MSTETSSIVFPLCISTSPKHQKTVSITLFLHLLCHIAEHNHSERLWRLLTQVMPNWKEVKHRLDSMAELYLNE